MHVRGSSCRSKYTSIVIAQLECTYMKQINTSPACNRHAHLNNLYLGALLRSSFHAFGTCICLGLVLLKHRIVSFTMSIC